MRTAHFSNLVFSIYGHTDSITSCDPDKAVKPYTAHGLLRGIPVSAFRTNTARLYQHA